jgi:transposase InsO family protein
LSLTPADAPSRREDYVADRPTIPESTSLRDKFVMAGQLECLGGVHDLHFQRPNAELIVFLKKNYSEADRILSSLTLVDGVLWHRDRIYVPDILRVRIMAMYHDSPAVGHPGIARTLSILLRTFSWPGVKSLVLAFVKTCDSCQRVKARRTLKDGKLVSLVPEPKPWSTIGMDMITKLPLSGGFDSVLVVIDLLSKLTHFIPCRESSLSAVLANLFRKNIFRLHGFPDKIVSDRGTTFVSNFWKALMNSLSIKSALSTAYHPQTDGQTERMNHILEDYLRHFCSYYQDNWDKCLDMAEFSLNNLDSASLKISPFFFTYGHHPKFNIMTESTGKQDLDEFLFDLQVTQETAMECLVQARIQQAKYYNKGKKDSPVYQEGDQVLLLRKFINHNA